MRHRFAVLLIVVSVLSRHGDARADSTGAALTITAAVKLAVAQYPSVAVARAVGDQARAAVGEARAAWMPTFSLAMSATQYEEPMLVSPIHSFSLTMPPTFDRTVFQSAVAAEYTLFDGGGRGARIRLAKHQAAVAEAGLDATQQALIARTVGAYLNVLGMREVLAAHDRRIAAFQSQKDRIRQLHDVGRAADVDILRIEAALTQAEADRVEVATNLDTAERDLARLLGLAPSTSGFERLRSVTLADSTLRSRDEVLAAVSARSPAITQAKSALAAADAGWALARSVHWPSVHAVGNYVDRRNEEGYHAAEWSAGLSLSLPLFTGGAVAHSVERARASARAAREQLRQEELRVVGDVDRALSAINAARARTRSLAAATERFAEIVRIEKLRLETGVGTQTDYLTSEADLLSASAGLTAARNAEIGANVELARISGELTMDWIAHHLEDRP
ncbi:MAG: TolC family protein [Candidatus Zixiibacteriota bacterium]